MANRKHQPILDYIYKCIDALDPTGRNTEVYKQNLEGMSEPEFEKFIKKFISDPNYNFTLEMDAFEQNVTVEQLKEAANIANVIVEDYIVMPYVSEDKDDPYVSNEKALLLTVNTRRVQQTLSVKNHVSTAMDKRNPKVGQVIDGDKNARTSDMEMYQLIFQGATNTLAENFGPKADDMAAKNEMLYQIQRKGSVSLSELPNSVKDKTALNYFNFLMLAAGYETDLVNGQGFLPITLERGGNIYK